MNSVSVHRRAEALMGEAELLASKGSREAAGKRFHDAALAEWEAFRLIPEERSTTRAILAVSTVSLYHRAAMLGADEGMFDELLRAADSFLLPGQVSETAQQEILELVNQARVEQKARIADKRLSASG